MIIKIAKDFSPYELEYMCAGIKGDLIIPILNKKEWYEIEVDKIPPLSTLTNFMVLADYIDISEKVCRMVRFESNSFTRNFSVYVADHYIGARLIPVLEWHQIQFVRGRVTPMSGRKTIAVEI